MQEQVATGVLFPIKMKTGYYAANIPKKALEVVPIEHLGRVVFAKLFHTLEDKVLWKMGI